MDQRLLQWLRCPQCREQLQEVEGDTLACRACGRRFPVRDGAPSFAAEGSASAVAFGHMWGEHESRAEPQQVVEPYHLRRLFDELQAPPFAGLIIDGGCGDGLDLAMLALDPACEVVGVELSEGGTAMSRARTRGLSRAHVVQADLQRLPLADAIFDGGYSYGVVHHTVDPARSVAELARVLRPGASLLFYVYEDFSDRPILWRLALRAVNSLRRVTTRLPPRRLMTLCRLMSPVVYVTCTVPSRYFGFAAALPYRHGTDAWSLGGDLFDRFSAPIERRYSEAGARRLAEQAGLIVVRTAQWRGWMVWAEKPRA